MPYHNLVPLFPGRVFNLTIPSGGVQTNFRMPDLFSIGLGGGSIVRPDGDASGGTVRVGPDSVAVTSRMAVELHAVHHRTARFYRL